MPQFQYRAKSTEQGTVTGTIEAETPSAAAAKVREMGYWPTQILEVHAPKTPVSAPAVERKTAPGSYIPSHTLLPGAPAAVMAYYWRQVAAMYQSGMTLTETMKLLAKNAQVGKVAAATNSIYQEINEGKGFAEALKRHPRVFRPQDVVMVEAGEKAGMIAEMATKIADGLEREIELRRKIVLESVYSLLVVLVLIFILNIKELIFGSPVVYFKETFGLLFLIVGILVGGYFIGRLLLGILAFREIYDTIKLNFPVIGRVVRRLSTARFCRLLGDLSYAGVPIIQAFRYATAASGNPILSKRLAQHAHLIEEGGHVATVLEKTHFFEPIVLSMAETGEMTGDMSGMLEKVSDHLDKEAMTTIHIAVIVGGVVLFLIVAIIVAIKVITTVLSYYAGAGGAASP